MAATVRLVVRVTPQEKKTIEDRARRAGVSTAEFVRRRIEEDELELHRGEIEALLAVLDASTRHVAALPDDAVVTGAPFMSTLDAIARHRL